MCGPQCEFDGDAFVNKESTIVLLESVRIGEGMTGNRMGWFDKGRHNVFCIFESFTSAPAVIKCLLVGYYGELAGKPRPYEYCHNRRKSN